MKRSISERFQHLVGTEPQPPFNDAQSPQREDWLLDSAWTEYGRVGHARYDDHPDFRTVGEIQALLTPERCKPLELLDDPQLVAFNRTEALFLDVETTGLSHGAGTIAFLVGLGVFEGERFVVHQYLCEDLDQEMAQLQCVLDLIGQKRFLVTYNGKSFDRSILENRFVLHRFMYRNEARLRQMPHLDLLHVGRRIWKGAVPDHCLGTLESQILGLRRGPDIPGFLIPQIYFDYLASRDPSSLMPVLRHNYLDVVSLAFLADRVSAMLSPRPDVARPCVDINLGRMLFRAGRCSEAMDRIRSALTAAEGEDLVKAGFLGDRVLRSEGASNRTRTDWWLEVQHRASTRPEPCVELSKLFEWRWKDAPQALEWAMRAWQRARYPDEDLAHRLNRLRHK